MTAVGETAGNVAPSYYELDPQVEAALIDDLVSQNAELQEAESALVLATINGNSLYANLARSLECKVFNGYFGNDPEKMAEEYGPYDNVSTFFVLVDKVNKKTAGVMRVIPEGMLGHKSSNDLVTKKCKTYSGEPVTSLDVQEIYEEFNMDPAYALDVATIAARPEYGQKATGSPIVLASLMRALRNYTQQHGYDDLLAIIDADPQQKLTDVGLPIKLSDKIATPFKYLGAEGNSFIHIPVAEVDQSVKKVHPVIYDYLLGDLALNGEATLSMQEQ